MIGLKRGTVKLVPHNPKWEEIFKKEKQLLKETFGDKIIAIEHIGSTAIPGIPAKPIIDINVGVKSLKVALDMKEKFEKLSYEYRPFVPGQTHEELKQQELYVKGPESRRTHYVHIIIFGSNYWKKDLLFRDYLRKNPARAKQYARLKEELARKHPNDRWIYTKNKEQFISQTLEMAKQDINLTDGQTKYLATIPDDKMVIVKPWNPKGLKIANQIIADIKRIEPDLELMLLGSLPLKISGQEDIDISVFCIKSEQSKHIDNFKKLFGEPTKIGRNSTVWDFKRDGFDVGVWLTDPTAKTTKAQIKVFNLLKSNPGLLKEYERIKVEAKDLSYKEYQRKKYEFYNRILKKFVSKKVKEILKIKQKMYR